ncbi:MAG: LysR family transcriptional regulator [Ilumatobacter sp.]|nr:LysR family transcriptional regulator [Ilumatobacter sp.]
MAATDPQIDIESLRTLIAVLERGGMTKAAQHLGVSQSAVSWKIKRLEQRVGRPLLIRDGHELRPTREGRVVLEDAHTIIELHDRIVHRLSSPEFSGTVRVGSNEEVGAARMAGILGRFKRMYPEATIEFLVDQSRRLTPLLDRGRIDVAVLQVVEEEVRPDDSVLWTERLHWATHRDMPYDEGEVPLITFGTTGFYRPVSEPILERHRIPYRYTVTAPTSSSVRAAVEAGLGVAVLREHFLTGDVVEWARAAELDPLPVSYQVVRTVPGEPSEVAGALVAAITEEFTDLPSRQPASV